MSISVKSANIQSMKTRTLLLLSTTLLATGCTQFSSYLADKGSHCPGIDIDPTVYRSGNKLYMKGQKAKFREQSYFFIDYKGPGRHCEKIDGSEGETVYHEITLNKQKEYVHTKNCGWTPTPPVHPLTTTGEQHNFDREFTGENREDINALWAYPAAAVGFVAVDIPTAIGTCCFAIISIPIELIKDAF